MVVLLWTLVPRNGLAVLHWRSGPDVTGTIVPTVSDRVRRPRGPALWTTVTGRDGRGLPMEVRKMNRKENKPRVDIYAKITDRIVADLEQGVRPWVKPWSAGNLAGRVTRPLRYNGTPYQGINVLLLWAEAVASGFVSPFWMTFKQSVELGGHVRKGEAASTVVYASQFTKTETDDRGDEVERGVPFLKAYSVFNADQIDDLPDRYYAALASVIDPLARIAHADVFFDATGAKLSMADRKHFTRRAPTTSSSRCSRASATPSLLWRSGRTRPCTGQRPPIERTAISAVTTRIAASAVAKNWSPNWDQFFYAPISASSPSWSHVQITRVTSRTG